MKNWNDYFSNGFIGHKYQFIEGFDFGDCTQRLGMYHIAMELRYELDLPTGSFPFGTVVDLITKLKELEVDHSGNLRRYTGSPYNDPKDWSRDQEIPIVIACGLCGLTPLLKRMLWRHLRQFPFFQNKDIVTWEWSYYVRALNWKWGYPLLYLLDLGLVVNSILRCLFARNRDDVGDDLNHSLSLIFASLRLPTFVNRFATWIYMKYRPKPFFIEGRDDVNNILLAWRWYFRQPEAPPFDELFEPIIRHYL